jgi:hypothetical protein
MCHDHGVSRRVVAGAVIALAACGRVGFDPANGSGGGAGGGGDAPGTTGDAHLHDDGGSGGSGSNTSGIDAPPPTACDEALTLQAGVPYATSTCTGHDLIDGCGPPNTQEVVFKFVVPATGSYQFMAVDAGSGSISNSTGIVNAACDGLAANTCDGIFSTNYDAGDVVYIVIEADAGGCASIDYEVMQTG